MPLPTDYAERVYAGVLGKLIGVYLGRPFEGWTYEMIMARLGEVSYYVHDHPGLEAWRRGHLVVTDDDLSGTFTFIRALADYGAGRALTSAQVGQTWLNYLVEERTTLWWGGLGNSTEHTAYLRLKHGQAAPLSGSLATNGQVTAEQIGAQIFIDGWAMVAPGDPELAAHLAGQAARVSHDGEAVYAAQLLAAMEAQAFVEPRLERLLETGLSLIPRDCVIARLVNDLRHWHATLPDWRAAREQLVAHYGYERYAGNCHVVPNHGLIHLGLLYGGDDFQRALTITNTAGWDTDCNSGNLGCLLGLKNGLAGIDAGPDWRGPVADRLYVISADGGRAITDAARETYALVNLGRALAGAAPVAPKDDARFHFALPGSVQGFRAHAPELTVAHAGERGLALRYTNLAAPNVARAGTATFIPPEDLAMPGYGLHASPTLYPGQTVRATVAADPANAAPITAGLFLSYYGADDVPAHLAGPSVALKPGATHTFAWRLSDPATAPIVEIGVALSASAEQPASGTVYLDSLTWDGAPELTFAQPGPEATLWRRAWVDAVDHFWPFAPEAFRLVQDEGTGLLLTGTREWADYTVSAAIAPRLAQAAGLAARVQGLRRYYALLLCADQRVRLVKALDGERVLAEAPLAVNWGQPYQLSLTVTGSRLRGSVDGHTLFDLTDPTDPLQTGAIALVITEGCLTTNAVSVSPAAT